MPMVAFSGGPCDEAEVPRTRGRMHGFARTPFRLVEIDLLLSEPQRLSIPERDQFHAQSRRVERDRCIDCWLPLRTRWSR